MNTRAVVGYEGLYEVSDAGEVISLPRRDAGGRRWPGKVMSISNAAAGYKKTCLSRNGEGKNKYVHRLVLEAFAGSPPTPSHDANHKNGIRGDNRLDNLEWLTRRDNIQDAIYRRNGIERSDVPICRSGRHELVGDNILKSGDVIRCRACHRERCREASRRYYLANREKCIAAVRRCQDRRAAQLEVIHG